MYWEISTDFVNLITAHNTTITIGLLVSKYLNPLNVRNYARNGNTYDNVNLLTIPMIINIAVTVARASSYLLEIRTHNRI